MYVCMYVCTHVYVCIHRSKFMWPAQPLSRNFWDAGADGMLGMYVCMYVGVYV